MRDLIYCVINHCAWRFARWKIKSIC